MIRHVSKAWLIVLVVVISHIVLPLTFILQLYSARHEILPWAPQFFTAGSFVLFIFLAGAWSWFGRIVRFSIPAALVVTAIATVPIHPLTMDFSNALNAETVISICISLAFFIFAVMALLGRRSPALLLDLAFPLRGGTFVVGQGGSNQMVNHHAVNRSQRYGLDILKLNSGGIRARGFYPSELARYAIWGAEVVSPCDALVVAAVDGLADLTPPERDSVNRAGNYVALQLGNSTIYLAHLMKGSICVKAGDRVRSGQLLGRVGNSGNTTEPHLHIHAEQGQYSGKFSGNPGIAIRFDGKYLVRNSRVRASRAESPDEHDRKA